MFHERGNMSKVLPDFLSKWTTERVREEGVNVIPNTEIHGVDLINNQVQLTVHNGKHILCDHVVVAVGSQPNVSLAKESGLEVDTVHGGYLVNAELVARKDIYVVCDSEYNIFIPIHKPLVNTFSNKKNDNCTIHVCIVYRLEMLHAFLIQN